MGRPLRLAIAGLGLVGSRHADAITHVPGVTLCAVIDPNPAGQAAATERGVAAYSSLADFFASSGADGIILATPNALHVEQGLACVEKGVPTLVEKPLATRSKDGETLVDAAEAGGVPLLVGHHRRYNPLISAAKDVIEQGRIGDIRAVHATCWFYKPDAYFDEAPWRQAKGAGPVSVNLVHDVDVLRYLCGEISSVVATARPSARGHQNEDVASALLEFTNGGVGTLSVSDGIVAPWSWEMTSREHPIYPPTSESCYLLGGSHGSLSLPDLRVWQHENGDRDWWSPIAATSLLRDASDPLVNQIQHFAEVIRGRAKPLVSGREGLQSLRVVEAIQTSAAQGTRVTLYAGEPKVAPQARQNI